MATSVSALAFGDEQDAVQVVADVVHRHREVDLAERGSCSVFCGTLKLGAEVGRFLHQREVVGRQRLQREAALAGLQRQLGLRSTSA